MCLKASACARKKRKYLLRPDYYKARERERSFNLRSENPLKALYYGVKERCVATGTDFNIELNDLVATEVCPVLKTEYRVRTQYAMSVDRIDPTKGYLKGNVQIISKKANTMKCNASPSELLKFAEWVNKTYG
jgi:hypothetical protein